MLRRHKPNKVLSKVPFLILIGLGIFISCTHIDSTEPVLTTSSDSARYYYQIGVEKQRRLKMAESSFYFLRALSFDPDFAMANLELSSLQADQRIALKYFKRAKKMFDKISHGEQLEILATEAAINGNQVLQRKYVKQMMDDFPGNVPYLATYGNFLFMMGEYKEAIPIYLKAIELDPLFHQSYNQVGYAYRNINDLENAEIYLKKYMEVLPNEVNPLDSYAELMVKIGNFEKGLNVYRKAVNTDPNFLSANIGIATSLTYLDRTDEARNHLLKYYQTLSSNDERRNVNFTIAATHLWDENMQSAVKVIQKNRFISDVTGNTQTQINDIYNMSQVYYEYGYKDSAGYYLNQIDKIAKKSLPTGNPALDSIIIHSNLVSRGFYELTNKNYKAADSIGNLYLSKYSVRNSIGRKLNGYTLLGFSALEQKKYNQVYDYFHQVGSIRAVDKYYRGYSNEMRGKIELALKEYRGIINDNPILSMGHAMFYNKASARLRKLESASVTP